MKKLFFLILFFCINILTFGANVYFLNDGPGYIYTNGQTFYSNQDGRALVAYHLWADPAKYTIDQWGANFQDPNGNWSGWSHNSTSYGLHECLKAGTWHVQGRVHVAYDIYGYSDYWMYTSFTLYFYVVDNTAPSAPQNLIVTVVGGQGVTYPKLEWNLNSEYDVVESSQAYLIERRLNVFGNGNWTAWEEIGNEGGSSSTYIDYSINDAGSGPKKAQYRIRAKDINNNYSNYSSVVEVSYGTSQQKIVPILSPDVIRSYALNQNFPNPFNPTTSISYSLEKPGYVSLIVYNLLGQEVAELVNESQEKGYHAVNFNASNLPSGIYIYKLNAGEFTAIKKMQLIK
jgi:hypothetical protein